MSRVKFLTIVILFGMLSLLQIVASPIDSHFNTVASYEVHNPISSNEASNNETLVMWAVNRYSMHMGIILMCLWWAFYDPKHSSYEPPHIDLDILDSTKWKFAESGFTPVSIGEEMWHLGINRNLIQLEAIRKPTSPLRKTMDSLLDQLKQDMTDSG